MMLNKIFGKRQEKALNAVDSRRGGWFRILEPFSGAWQRNIEEKRHDLITYPALFACINRLSSDIGKLPFHVLRRQQNGVYDRASSSDFNEVLKKPNGYQTAGQFREYWMITKLTNGNAYALKERDARGRVTALYLLDPERVMPMVSDSGRVYYQLYTDSLNGLPDGYPFENLVVPSSEIIHDRCMTVHHPLIGVPPLAAAYWPALKNFKILKSATEFFANNAQPGGLLTAPAGMGEEDAKTIQEYWNTNFTQGNSGKVAIIGADMKFTPFAMKSIDAQMIEQMRYSDEQICQPFGIKPYKIGIGNPPAGWKAYDINTEYYSDALQPHIEHMETLLEEGLGVEDPLTINIDTEPLLRMDEISRAEVAVKLTGGGVETPNEGRSRFGLPPLPGGDTVYLQQQDIPLDQAMLNVASRPDQDVQPEEEPKQDSEIDEIRAYIATQKAINSMKLAMESADAI